VKEAFAIGGNRATAHFAAPSRGNFSQLHKYLRLPRYPHMFDPDRASFRWKMRPTALRDAPEMRY
jgi:hypothetical protein